MSFIKFEELFGLGISKSYNEFTPQIRAEKLEKIKSIISDRGLHYPLDVALVGATGVGKSSTINALFGETLAKVGMGVEPETQFITEYQTERFRLHDTAGLGDGLATDKRHAMNLSDLLLKTFDEKQYHLIDLCLVILDGSSRDMGTTYKTLGAVL
ncbi:GTPase, partial [Rodentibacter rarus]|uniref:GTPase n=1 Tax=Rodentibacter rarus TaxID=1908260 RepID=UPI0015C3E1E3